MEFPTGSCQQRQPLPLPPPTGRHTNFKSLITPDLGCFLTVASGAPAGEKAPVTFTFICKVWGEGPPPALSGGGRMKQNSQLGRLGVKVRSYKERVPGPKGGREGSGRRSSSGGWLRQVGLEDGEAFPC